MMRSRSASRAGGNVSLNNGYDDVVSISNSSSGFSRPDTLPSFQRGLKMPQNSNMMETRSDGRSDGRQSFNPDLPTRQRAKSPARSNIQSNNNTSMAVPMSTNRSSIKLSTQQLSLQIHKPGRVKVGIRCRPAFQDEIEFAQGEFFSIIDCYPASESQGYRDEQAGVSLDRISLTLLSGKQRDFAFDFAFNSSTTQDELYDKIARPVVKDVLQGFNGTGKTYTMGILEFVDDEHAGIIPRAIAQIFDYTYSQNEVNITVSMSFLQIYRETIQDLLAPATGPNANTLEDNLAIREDPQRGFYVEGLQEFTISNYQEAEALLNLGLENRAMAPTLMNTTSSRSHTILTLNIDQRGVMTTNESMYGAKYSRNLHSKLLMVDLAGSERVRRTVSKGARLSEAKSINTSLSALGNVIAALAEPNATHIPYRDSKLTRLLQDSLGGTASTALIATVGPAPVNYGETLSTLMFASRCMAVKTTPIQHQEVDYAEMCVRLQEKIGTMEKELSTRLQEQQAKYETIMQVLQQELINIKAENQAENSKSYLATSLPSSLSLQELDMVLNTLTIQSSDNPMSSDFKAWMYRIIHGNNTPDIHNTINNLSSLLGYCFEILQSLCIDSTSLLEANLKREEERQNLHISKMNDDIDMERIRELESNSMENEDTYVKSLKISSEHSMALDSVKIGSHLASLSYIESRKRVHNRHVTNNDTKLLSIAAAKTAEVNQARDTSSEVDNRSQSSQGNVRRSSLANQMPDNKAIKPSKSSDKGISNDELLIDHSYKKLYELKSWEDIGKQLVSYHHNIRNSVGLIQSTMITKDHQYDLLKEELIEQLVERRKREEEVVNWSFILKYLLNTSSKLKSQLQQEKQRRIIASPSFQSKADSKPAALANQHDPSLPIEVESVSDEDIELLHVDSVDEVAEKVDQSHKNPVKSDSFITRQTSNTIDSMKASSTDSKVVHDSGPTNSRNPNSRLQLFPELTSSDGPYRDVNGQGSMSNANGMGIGRNTNTGYATPSTMSIDSNRVREFQSFAENVNSRGNQNSLKQHDIQDRSHLTIQRPDSTKNDRGSSSTAPIPSDAMRLNLPLHRPPNGMTQPLTSTNLHRVASGGALDSSNFLKSDRQQPINDRNAKYYNDDRRYAPSDDEMEDNEGRSIADSDIAPSNLSFRSAATVTSIPLQVPKPPSLLAQSIVQDLGVEGASAVAAMQVIDRVSQITPEQLNQLDPATRAQILQIRADLGIDERLKSKSYSMQKTPSYDDGDSRRRRIADIETQSIAGSTESGRSRMMMDARRYQRNLPLPSHGSVSPTRSYQSSSKSSKQRPKDRQSMSYDYGDIGEIAQSDRSSRDSRVSSSRPSSNSRSQRSRDHDLDVNISQYIPRPPPSNRQGNMYDDEYDDNTASSSQRNGYPQRR